MSKRLLILALFASSALIDAPSYAMVGSISLLGLTTVAYAVAIALLILFQSSGSFGVCLRLWPLSLLFLYSAAQLAWHRLSLQAGQTLLLQWIFLGLVALLSASGAGDRDNEDEAKTSTKLCAASLFGALLYLIAFLLVGFGAEGSGAISFITARSFALFALLGVALFLARWSSGDRESLWFALALVLLIALSLSRTALVVAVILFPLSRIRSFSRDELRRVGLFAALAGLALVALVFSVDQLRTRFLGGWAVEDFVSGEASVDTSGRLAAWAVTLGSYVDSPWLGQGPGSANDLVDDLLYRLDIGHPLNEYLRFLHDEGVLGLVLLVLGYGQLVRGCWRAARRSFASRSSASSFHLATFLALVAALITMLTDNTASYLFVMGPLGVMVGITLHSLYSKGPEAPNQPGRPLEPVLGNG